MHLPRANIVLSYADFRIIRILPSISVSLRKMFGTAELQTSFILSFSFQPVLHGWCNKGRGMCYTVCGMVQIKEFCSVIYSNLSKKMSSHFTRRIQDSIAPPPPAFFSADAHGLKHYFVVEKRVFITVCVMLI